MSTFAVHEQFQKVAVSAERGPNEGAYATTRGDRTHRCRRCVAVAGASIGRARPAAGNTGDRIHPQREDREGAWHRLPATLTAIADEVIE